MTLTEIIDNTSNPGLVHQYRDVVARCPTLKNPDLTERYSQDQALLKSCLHAYEQVATPALEIAAVKAHCHHILAVMAQKTDNHVSALEHYQHALALIDANNEITEPTAKIYSDMAISADVQGNHQIALAYTARALEEAPENYEYYAEQASIQAKVQDYPGVIASCNQAESCARRNNINISSLNSEVILVHRGYAYMVLGEEFLALQDYEVLARKFPSKKQYQRICVKLCDTLKGKHLARIKDIEQNITEDFSHD